LLGVGTSPARVLARAEAPPAGAEPAPTAAPTSAEALARELVTRIADGIGVRGEVSVSASGDAVEASVSGPDIALLIGRDGRTIDAVQQVVSAIVRRAPEGEETVVEVDAGGYRARRRSRIEAAARSAAERAVATGEPVALESMGPLERKLAHVALQDVDTVETHSEGEEPDRYVVVAPVAPGAMEQLDPPA
jgi:spoIIIJ-associated protein